MATEIKCPNCGHQFEPNEAIRDEVQKELRNKMSDWQKKKNEEFQSKLEEEKKALQQTMEETTRKSIASEYETKLNQAQQNNRDYEEKLKEARQKEADFMRKEQDLKNREAEIELNVQKQLVREREKMTEDIRRIEEQKTVNKETEYQLRLKELEKQLEDQKRLAEEMRRKSEQGSTQLQGETQELLLEDMLRSAFPFDTITEVGKGVEGADCILLVRNNLGIECGKIIFESKRTKSWSNGWIDKLKSDMRGQQADLAILVSQVYPKGMEGFGEKEGIWIASFKECVGLTMALRNAIIRVAETKRSEENKGEKMQMLYNYLTGIEFKQNIEAIVEGFVSMKQSITRERIQMEKLWKEREKQLEKVLLNTSGLYGSIKGIAGASVQDIPLLETSTDEEDDQAH
jgi:hypothetical protein